MVAIKGMKMPKYCLEVTTRPFYSDEVVYGHCPFYNICTYRETIKSNFKPANCPLVEIEERKVGKWIGDKAYPICPNCNCNIIEEYISHTDYAEMYKPMNFCPNCGAEMRGSENG